MGKGPLGEDCNFSIGVGLNSCTASNIFAVVPTISLMYLHVISTFVLCVFILDFQFLKDNCSLNLGCKF